MKHSVTPPRYLTVALSIAKRIASGELKEGQSLYGRSILASQYETSPETIRRALSLLAEMEVVEVKPQSGTKVLSVENANSYISYFEKDVQARKSYEQICDLIQQYDNLNKSLMEAIDNFANRRVSMVALNSPLPNYEIPISDTSELVGMSIGETKFWGLTGCTIVAVKRGDEIILSPGPYEQLCEGDSVIVVGAPSAVERAGKILQNGAGNKKV